MHNIHVFVSDPELEFKDAGENINKQFNDWSNRSATDYGRYSLEIINTQTLQNPNGLVVTITYKVVKKLR